MNTTLYIYIYLSLYMSQVYYSPFPHILHTHIFNFNNLFNSFFYFYFLHIIISGSSETLHSGLNIAPVKSNFSKTCKLFSQYLKENNTFPDLTLGRRVRTPSTATMNLFPMVETPRFAVKKNESKSMTVFYNGQVIVFNDLAPEKGNEIMKLAEKGVCQKHRMKQDEVVKNTVLCRQPVVSGSDLPIARKASLTRFLEKRKARITSRSPYQAQAISKQDDSKSWLGLSAQSHIQFQP